MGSATVSPLEVVCKNSQKGYEKCSESGSYLRTTTQKYTDPMIQQSTMDHETRPLETRKSVSSLDGLPVEAKPQLEWDGLCLGLIGDGVTNMCFPSTRAWHQGFSLLLGGLHYGTFSTSPNTGTIEITNISGKRIENLQ